MMNDNEMIQPVEDASADAPVKVEACEAGADRCCRKGKRGCKKEMKCKEFPRNDCEWDYMRPPKPCGRRFRKKMMKECMENDAKEDKSFKVSAKEYEEFKALQERHKKRAEWMEKRKKNMMLRHGRCHPHPHWRNHMRNKMTRPSMPQPMQCQRFGPHHHMHGPCNPHKLMMMMWMRRMMKECQPPCHKGWDRPMGPHHHHNHHMRCMQMNRFPPQPQFGWGPRPCGPWQQWGPQPPRHHHCHKRGLWGEPMPYNGFNQWNGNAARANGDKQRMH